MHSVGPVSCTVVRPLYATCRGRTPCAAPDPDQNLASIVNWKARAGCWLRISRKFELQLWYALV